MLINKNFSILTQMSRGGPADITIGIDLNQKEHPRTKKGLGKNWNGQLRPV